MKICYNIALNHNVINTQMCKDGVFTMECCNDNINLDFNGIQKYYDKKLDIIDDPINFLHDEENDENQFCCSPYDLILYNIVNKKVINRDYQMLYGLAEQYYFRYDIYERVYELFGNIKCDKLALEFLTTLYFGTRIFFDYFANVTTEDERFQKMTSQISKKYHICYASVCNCCEKKDKIYSLSIPISESESHSIL